MTQRIGDALSGKAVRAKARMEPPILFMAKHLPSASYSGDALAASRQIGPRSKGSRFYVARPFGSSR